MKRALVTCFALLVFSLAMGGDPPAGLPARTQLERVCGLIEKAQFPASFAEFQKRMAPECSIRWVGTHSHSKAGSSRHFRDFGFTDPELSEKYFIETEVSSLVNDDQAKVILSARLFFWSTEGIRFYAEDPAWIKDAKKEANLK
jgi:hypothetical protein